MRFFSFWRALPAGLAALGLAIAFMLVSPAAFAAITFDNTPSGGAPGAANIELIRDTAGGSPTGQYVGLRFSSSIALTNVYARAIVGGVGYSLDATELQDHSLGELTGSVKTSFWFINIPATTANGTFRVEIYRNGPPGIGTLEGTSSSYGLVNADVDQPAAANKINSVVINGGSSIVLGQDFNAVVCYDVNSSNGTNIAISPAATSTFDPTGLQLLNVPSVQAFGTSGCTGTLLSTNSNQLYYTGVGNGGLNSMRATYTFRAMNPLATPLSPIVSARSGQYKYNSDFNTFTGSSVPAASNAITLTKSVSVTESPGAVAALTYTITATNTASVTVTLDSFIDTLPSSPASVTYLAGSAKFNGAAIADPVVSGQALTWSNPGGATAFSIPGNSSRGLTFQASIPGTNGVFTNSAIAKIGSVVIDTTLAIGDNVPATAVTRLGPPVLAITKTADTPTVVNTAAGTTARYTLKVANIGTTAAGVKLSDTGLPAGFTYLSTVAVNTPTSGTCATAATRTTTVNPTAAATEPSWGDFTIPGGCEVSVQFDASVANTVADGTYSNSASTTTTTASATITNFDGTPTATIADNVTVTSPVLTVTKTTSTPNVGTGAPATYSITVTNSGTGNATGVKVSDTLPDGFAYASTTSVTLNGTAVAAAGFIAGGTAAVPTWDTNPSAGFTVNAGQTLVIVFTATASATTGLYNNNASATSANAKTITNFDGTASTAEDVTVSSIILTVIKTTSTPTVVNTSTGTSATYTVTVTNSGSANATGVKLSDTLPAGFTFASTSSVTLNDVAVLPANYTRAGTAGVPTWDTNPAGGFTIEVGKALVITFVANVANTVADGTYNNSASTTSTNATSITNFDGTLVANTSDDVAVTSPVLAVTKTTGTPTVVNTPTGTTATYTVTVTNSGSANATGVKLSDTLPEGFTYAGTSSVTVNGAAVASTGYSVAGTAAVPTWDTNPASGFTVDAGQTLVVTFVANIANTVADGTYNNSASTTSSNAKTITNFDGAISATDNVAVTSAVLAVTKTTGTPTVINTSTGTTATYTVTVTNSGSANATGVKASDTLPTGFTYASTSSITLNGTAVLPANYLASGTAAVPTWDTNPTGGFAVDAGKTLVITFVANVAGTVADGTYDNSASTTSSNAKTITNFDGAVSATDNVAVTSAVLAVTKTTGTPTVINTSTGTTATYTVTVKNNGSAAATGVVLTDSLAAGFSYNGGASSVTLDGTALATTVYTETAGVSPMWTTNPAGGFTINAGATLVVTFTAKIASSVADGTYHNSASVTSAIANSIANFDGAVSTTDNVTVASASLAVTKTTSTPAVTNTASGTTATYTVTVANTGTANATGVKVSDTLAAGFSYASTSSVTVNGAATTAYTATGTTTATWDTNPAGGFTINAGQNLVITFVANVSSAVAPGTYSNSAFATSTNAKTISDFVGANNTSDDVTVSAPVGVSLYGTAYNDANHNLQRDGGEGGTGLTLYAKLIPGAGGSALQAVAVNPGTGAYTLVTVTPGNYSIILDDNNVLTDATPTIPSGWIGTEMPDFRRTNVQVAATDLQNLNFGLFNGGKLSGLVFADLGTGAGTANNGIKDGSEAGVAGVTVKVTNGGGTATFDSAVTSADGAYTLWIPTAAVAAMLQVVQTNLAGYLSTGASVGNTGGSYDRASDSTTLNNQSGGIFTGVNFGDVPVNRFIANGQQAGQPGNVVFYPHQFNAGSGGSVSLSAVSASSWPVVLYRDLNCNGVIDAGDPVISAASSLVANEQLCIVNKVTIPPGTALGAQDAATLQAVFTYTNANPALGATLLVIDSTTVGAGSSGLVLVKTADKATALPGDTINYTVSYQNNSSTPLATIVISDATPAFTTFLSAACNLPLPTAITLCTFVTAPVLGGGTSIQWTLTGSLNPASVGQVVFAVKVNN